MLGKGSFTSDRILPGKRYEGIDILSYSGDLNIRRRLVETVVRRVIEDLTSPQVEDANFPSRNNIVKLQKFGKDANFG